MTERATPTLYPPTSPAATGEPGGPAPAPVLASREPDAGVGGMLARTLVGVAVFSALIGAAAALLATWRPISAGSAVADVAQKTAPSVVLFAVLIVLVVMFAAAAAAFVGALAARSLTRRIAGAADALTAAAHAAALGDGSVRVQLAARMPLRGVGQALDLLIERSTRERDALVAQARMHADGMQRLAMSLDLAASRRDLSVALPQDTGRLVAAVEGLISATAGWLAGIADCSREVADSTVEVRSDADQVRHAAASERQALESAEQAMSDVAASIADLQSSVGDGRQAAGAANDALAHALSTSEAVVSVADAARERFQAAVLGIAQLESRVQAFSRVVSTLDTIVASLSVSSLNASMLAASDTELAGRLGPLADDVEALSRATRRAAADVSRLVAVARAESANTAVAVQTASAEAATLGRAASQAVLRLQEARDMTIRVDVVLQRADERAAVAPAAAQRLTQQKLHVEETRAEVARLLDAQADAARRLAAGVGQLLDRVGAIRLPDMDD